MANGILFLTGTLPLLTDPLLLDYRNRTGLARVNAGDLRVLPPR